MSLSLRPLRETDVAALESRAAHDDEGSRRRLGMPPARWWSLVRSDPRRHGWIVLHHGREVGYLDAEQDDPCVHIALLLFPEARGHGLAAEVMQHALTNPVLRSRSSVCGYVEVDNGPARRAAQGAGFCERGLDQDGLMIYRRSGGA